MRLPILVGLLVGILMSTPGFADSPTEPPGETAGPPPPLLANSLLDALPAASRKTTAWTVALVAGGASLGLTTWGLGTALSHLEAPDGPPLGTTVAGLAWGTGLMAVAGLAVDYLVHAP